MARGSFREQVLKVREDAIVSAVNRLLAEKGFDLMTVDEVAADVGIAKASLYKHFPSKEALAAAAMVRVLQHTAAVIDQQPASLAAIDKLEAVTRWALEVQLAGEMPTLPSQNSTLRAELLGSKAYIDLLMQVSDQLGAWIQQAQADGAIDPGLPPEVVLYTIFARACDPVPGFLKAAGQMEDAQIVDLVLRTCFGGLRTR
ncbi:TetR/AcrR family transcriptional regulator [Rubrivivax albus]|uniref:TetR/AcrR family transcriptional regulator n=1 Tax=Rubrivivax albus TaxID=2499835 RepID=A0A437JWC4_9BURK|nr:TetR/AcrR family transcriptional regulator [Rubrivivax albus]RVT51705.1 TetR/AcrR family transcriptional regulator [Rubrivivax albus]